MSEPVHVTVTGAAGRVSYALLFRIAAGAMFGADQPVALSLLEVPEAIPLLDATIMELEDCAFPLLKSVRASTDATEAFAAADWVILIGSAPYRTDMTRLELLRANGPMYQLMGRAINESAKTARILVVANPCNTNCLIARSSARYVPSDHWFGLTTLDQNRARAILARKAKVTVEQVTRVTVWGNHSPSVFADFQNAWIANKPAHRVIHDSEWVRNVFEPGVAGRSQMLYDAQGASPAGSTTQAILDAVRSLTMPSHRWFSAAVVSDGSYTVPRGLIFGFPLVTHNGRTWSIDQRQCLDDHARGRIAKNIAELELEAVAVKDLMKGRVY